MAIIQTLAALPTWHGLHSRRFAHAMAPLVRRALGSRKTSYFNSATKSRLFEMVIPRQCPCDSIPLHDHKRNAVGQRPLFVGATGIKGYPFLLKPFV